MRAEAIRLDPELAEAIERRLAGRTSAEGRAPARERPFEASVTELALAGSAGNRQASQPGRRPAPGVDSLNRDDLLTVAMAAALAGRSPRTIRRAYRSGALLAYRDGNGRGIRIRYGDLRQWMMAATVGMSARQEEDEVRQLRSPLERLDMNGKASSRRGPSENLALLKAARRRNGGVRGGVGGRRAADSAASQRA